MQIKTKAHSHPRPEDFNYFFVCGYMRSGTNWVENLLNLHPNIICQGEFHLDQLRVKFDSTMNETWYSLLQKEQFRAKAVENFEYFLKSTIFATAMEENSISNKDPKWLGDRTPRFLYPLMISGAKHFAALCFLSRGTDKLS